MKGLLKYNSFRLIYNFVNGYFGYVMVNAWMSCHIYYYLKEMNCMGQGRISIVMLCLVRVTDNLYLICICSG